MAHSLSSTRKRSVARVRSAGTARKKAREKELRKKRASANRAYAALRKRGVYPFEVKSHRKELGLQELSFHDMVLVLDEKHSVWDWEGDLLGLVMRSVWPQDELYRLMYSNSPLIAMMRGRRVRQYPTKKVTVCQKLPN